MLVKGTPVVSYLRFRFFSYSTKPFEPFAGQPADLGVQGHAVTFIQRQRGQSASRRVKGHPDSPRAHSSAFDWLSMMT